MVEIMDNGRYEEILTVNVADNAGIELRAANSRNPHLALNGPLTVSGGKGSRFSINGCLVSVPSDKLVVLQGLKDIIVVETDDILLVCKMEDEQKIKNFVNDVRIQKGSDFV